LVLIDHIDVLPQLFETVLVPEAVHAELRNAAAPAAIQTRAKSLPSWVEVRQVANIVANISDDTELRPLGAGEAPSPPRQVSL
jgi:predicted nucleic acid-binding protein